MDNINLIENIDDVYYCEQCGKLGLRDEFQEIAKGADERGEFIEYKCKSCFHVMREYPNGERLPREFFF